MANAPASFAVIPAELMRVHLFGAVHGPFVAIPLPEGCTLFTYMFLHGDVFHLLSNMLFLWVFGDNVEDAMGHLRFIAFYLACGAAGALAHAFAHPTSTQPLIGASGAVAGVIAAYLLLHPRARVWVLAFRIIPLRIAAVWVLGAWAATQFVMLLLGPREVAWWAHIGGMAAGAVLILFLRRPGVRLFDRARLALD